MTDQDDVEADQDDVEAEEAAVSRHEAKMVALTEEENKRVDDALSVDDTQQVATKNGILIVGSTIRRLGSGAGPPVWLNDEIVNYYFQWIAERQRDQGSPRIYCFSTFFYTRLTQNTHRVGFFYPHVARWTLRLPGAGLFDYDELYFPLHLDLSHWALVRVMVGCQRIEYYDSMGLSSGRQCLKNIRRYLKREMAKYGIPYHRDDWTLWLMNSPPQLNTHDCGVFMCKIADYLSDGVPLLFTQLDIPYFRRRMVLEIVNDKP